MPLQATSGAASYDAFGGGVPVVPNYIEDVFSTYLYTGNGSTQTITNGIDLSTKGGLVWGKDRNRAADHSLYDTARGVSNYITTDSTGANVAEPAGRGVTSFNTTGFSLGTDSSGSTNDTGQSYVSWTFREQPKFFDIVTWTGTGSNRTIAHSLGSVPGSIFVKRTDTTGAWQVYHRANTANPETDYLVLNSTAATADSDTRWNDTAPTSAVFSLGTDASVNASGGTYVAYIFAHDAGGFGLTGTDNVISCGGFTTDGGGLATVSLGYEPQWLMIKRTGTTGDWQIMDTMRGFVNNSSGGDAVLKANSSDAESTFTLATPTSTGFLIDGNAANAPIIYIAIRRGPMKVPTSGTSVFSPIAYTGNGTTNTTVQNLTTSFAGDTTIIQQKTSGNNPLVFDKLRGKTQGLYTSLTFAEENISTARAGQSVGFNNTQTVLTGRFTDQGNYNSSGDTFVGWNFARAPSFFDEVCYTGTGSATTFTHNLTVVPEMMIVKRRDTANAWAVYANNDNTDYLVLNTTAATADDNTYWNDTSPTSSVFSVGTNNAVNASASTYVAYLFATCAGVSKVGSYTGNGSTQTINCGFGAGGARFVLIKRTDSTGGWYVYDTARGMTLLTDPYLLLNSTAAEVATLGSVTTVSTGFALDSTILAAINISAASYIFLAIS